MVKLFTFEGNKIKIIDENYNVEKNRKKNKNKLFLSNIKKIKRYHDKYCRKINNQFIVELKVGNSITELFWKLWKSDNKRMKNFFYVFKDNKTNCWMLGIKQYKY